MNLLANTLLLQSSLNNFLLYKSKENIITEPMFPSSPNFMYELMANPVSP